jgi:hypothetical protein
MADRQTANKGNSRTAERRAMQEREITDVGQELIDYLSEYARESPEKTALWCLGIGFILGWKLKPW